MRRFPVGCKVFAAGMMAMLVLLVIISLVIASLQPGGVEKITGALTAIATFLLGVLATMSLVGTVLLLKLTWSVETPSRHGMQQRQPTIVIHGGGQPHIQQGQPALPAPPPEWPRQTRDYHMLGEEDVTNGQYRHLPPNT